MIALYIVLSLLLLLGIIALLPVGVDISFRENFLIKVIVGGIKVFEIEPKEDEKKTDTDTESDKKAEEQVEGLFKKLKNKLGFTGAVKEIFLFIFDLLKRIKGCLKHILIRKLCLDIKVASKNAALTAIEYGVVCSAVYPTLSFIDSIANVKMKKINVASDFEGDTPEFSFSVKIRVRIIYLLLMAIAALLEYKKFRTRNEL